VSLEVSGRELVIAGERAIQETEGRVYQQVEIDSGPFRRVVELGADVDAEAATASYTDGILRVELPLAEPEDNTRRVPIERADSDG
jgi:HSP20 family protein